MHHGNPPEPLTYCSVSKGGFTWSNLNYMLYQKGKCVSVWSVALLGRRGGSAGSAREAVRAARAVQVIRLSLTRPQETEGRAVRGTRPLQSCTKQSEKIKHCNKTSPTLQQRIRVGSFVSHKVLCLILKVDEASVSWLQTGNLFHRRGTYTYSFLKGLYK